MIESKCIEVDKAQSSTTTETRPRLNNEHWQALIALYRTLLYEHHDFFFWLHNILPQVLRYTGLQANMKC
ncbi:uncharacterized protein CTRU02_215623 [Colletotrichum truncatum]|uniref:Uncharacterized protein n=1 Tax=Colletotrichum truncatum TaxID=5467 RepID=A0ACC3YCE7_COLTU|nr:uncharacterized protein CTRU02_05436 [Colletotrichum truncatum]KAF6793879.1 hypothetical protein CTRU02_05436 [Colletotrichum truncatum]